MLRVVQLLELIPHGSTVLCQIEPCKQIPQFSGSLSLVFVVCDLDSQGSDNSDNLQ